MENKKLTKKQVFMALLNVKEVAKNKAFTDFIQHEIALLDRKNSPRKTVQAQDQKLRELILCYLKDFEHGLNVKRLQAIPELDGVLDNFEFSLNIRDLQAFIPELGTIPSNRLNRLLSSLVRKVDEPETPDRPLVKVYINKIPHYGYSFTKSTKPVSKSLKTPLFFWGEWIEKNNKPTKKETFMALLHIKEIAENETFADFIQHELYLLEKKNTSRKTKEIQQEDQKLKELIIHSLMGYNCVVSMGFLQYTIPELENISNQRLDYLLHSMSRKKGEPQTPDRPLVRDYINGAPHYGYCFSEEEEPTETPPLHPIFFWDEDE